MYFLGALIRVKSLLSSRLLPGCCSSVFVYYTCEQISSLSFGQKVLLFTIQSFANDAAIITIGCPDDHMYSFNSTGWHFLPMAHPLTSAKLMFAPVQSNSW